MEKATTNEEEYRPGAVRKELYAYLEAEGFNVTEERHKKISALVKEHTRRATLANTRDRMQAMNALHNVKHAPKLVTMERRLEDWQCPICGVDMKDRGKGEYLTECGHLKGVLFTYA